MSDWRRILEPAWAAAHVATWAGLMLTLHLAIAPFPWWKAALGALLGSLAWEGYEMYLERAHHVEPEHPVNRWVVDPLCGATGGLLGWAVAHCIWRWA